MYAQREEDGNLALLVTRTEAWILMSLATVGLNFTSDDTEITLLMALQELSNLMSDDELLELAMDEEALHGHGPAELAEIENNYRKAIDSARREGRRLLD